MAEVSEFISRTGTARAAPGVFFSFAGDFRNFSRFIPEENVSDWQAGRDSCSFEISPLGKASVSITERKPLSLIKYEGEAISSVPFKIWLQMTDPGDAATRFRIVLRTELNPFFRMMASGAIEQYLSRLVDEIESFSGWDDITEYTQSP
ncbi:MAG: hypothetical protein FJY11_07085 [Bacteroidetes bacterium]|nr:hypothetical protein [Bacteroidota bacterium]